MSYKINALKELVDGAKMCLIAEDEKRIRKAKRKRFFFKGDCERHGHTWVQDWDRQWEHGKTFIKCYFCNQKEEELAEWF